MTLPQSLKVSSRRLLKTAVLLPGFISLTLIHTVFILALPINSPAQSRPRSKDENKIDESVARQIKALDDEKESRTPAQQKIDSQLIYAGKMYQGQQIAAGVPTLEVDVGLKDDGRVIVDITTIVDEELLGAIKENDGEILQVSEEYQSVRASLPISRLEAIAGLPQVRFIQPKQGYKLSQQMRRPAISIPSSRGHEIFASRATYIQQLISEALAADKILPNGTLSVGSVASEGDATHRAATARGTFNVDGAGIKIGVLSDGVTNLASAQALGDLGAVTVLPSQTGTGDEGTAMLEIIHDVAPGAQLYFATANSSITSFAQNIRDLRAAGCDIIVDDVSYFAESPFQDGTPGVTNTNGGVVTQAVNDVVADGALYFSSAANSGNKNDNTSTTWEGDFVSGGTLAITPGGIVNDFDPSPAVSQINVITAGAGTGIPINLSWSDSLGASNNDYDLFILNNAGNGINTSSTNVQNGTQDPYEQVSTNNTTGRRIVIRQKTGAAKRFLHLDLNGGLVTFNTPGETHGHAAASGGYGVAATPAYSAFKFPPPINFGPYPGAFSSANSVETFSSDGPRKIFYQGNGTAITPGDFSSTGGQVLQQPLITAADGVAVTGAGDFSSPFFGTSAAAPHAAAIAALIKSANPAFTQAQIKTALTSTAIDVETAGTDRDAGFGIVMPYPALQSLSVTGKAFLEPGAIAASESCCNNNGLIERNESGLLNITLNNPGMLDATGITATLTTTTPGVTVWSGSSNYADLAATSGSGTNATPFGFSVFAAADVDTVIDFTLTVNYSGGWNASQIINFKVATGRKPVTTVLDTTPPATDLNFPAAGTGTQTNIIIPDDPASTCAAPTSFPGTFSSTTPRFDSYTLTNITTAPVCATVDLTADRSAAGALQVVAYTGTFNPASVGTNYLGDAGFSAIAFPGYPAVFSVNVPAGGTVVLTVVELKSPSNGFPTAVGSTYTLKVSGLPVTLLSVTAAEVEVSGRITARGRGIGGAKVSIINAGGEVRSTLSGSFGYYYFGDVQAGGAYVLQVSDKRYKFAPQVITINESRTDLNFEAQ
jgi:hypothetical protein